MSPARSLGTKEYGCPHLVQNPSVRPGRSPRARPTGAPQSEREQYRLRSGTSGLSSTIARGSGLGTCGTTTSPAPSRPRPEGPEAEPEPRTDTERPPGLPDSERESRPDTERRERADCEELRVAPPLIPVGAEPTEPTGSGAGRAAGETTGASPQVSQYSSPPPMSS